MEDLREEDVSAPDNGLKQYLSLLGAIALSFGYAVGWGAFMMPGTTFLPGAGPLGTLLGVLFGALAMVVFAINYHRLSLRFSGPGGAYSFAQRVFGEDHGFLVAWFLWLTYIAILWANATAMILIVRFTLGDVLQFGFHYKVAGFDVYLGEVLLSIFTILIGGVLCLVGKRLAVAVQILFATLLAFGVFAFFAFALIRHDGGVAAMGPPFMDDIHPILQISRILALMPWAFVGFEAITHSSSEFRFPVKRTAAILIASIVLSTLVYIFLALLPVVVLGNVDCTWLERIREMAGLSGIKGVPVFTAAEHLLGRVGVALMSTLMIAGQITGIIAALIATSRLMLAMSKADILPKWCGALDGSGTPRNAILLVMAVSCVIPFFGRTAIGWPVDVSSIGAAIAYGYTSAAAFRSCQEGDSGFGRFWGKSSAVVGVVLAVFFCLLLLIPNYISGSVLAAPSYLLLAVWCILGFLYHRKIFKDDRNHRFGRSVVVWNSLVITIIFASLMWVRQAAFENAKSILYDYAVAELYEDGKTGWLLGERIGSLNVSMLFNAAVEMFLILVSIVILSSLLSILRKRELELVAENTRKDDINRAKTFFFSTVSHDIRTPLNAILGFSQMLKDGFKTKEEQDQAIDSILMSGKTLLKLVNDVLDLSKLEAGRMDIEPEPTNCRHLLEEVAESFRISIQKPHLDVRAKVEEMPVLMLDPQRLRQIAFNLMGNAVKFTALGFVEVRASFTFSLDSEQKDCGVFFMEVEDSGCGIAKEDLPHVLTPYVQVGSKASRHGGTGLGLAITRELVNAMGGQMTIASTLGKGTTFRITIPNVKVGHLPEKSPKAEVGKPVVPKVRDGRRVHRLLLVDDQKVNLIVLKAMLAKIGEFDLMFAFNGQEAMKLLETPDTAPFDMVMTDMWMPEMDGVALVEAIRKNPRLSSLPVYAITADVESTKSYVDLGFSGLLLKPVTFESLLELFQELGYCD